MNVVDFSRELIEFDSTCHLSNAEVSDFVESAMKRLGFETERVEYMDAQGERKVNVLGCKGSGAGGLAYFGHTDVVPADNWRADPGPFQPVVRDGRLYGRGSTDMKGSIACMFAAVAQVADRPLQHPIYLSCTADEEVNHGGADAIVRDSAIYRQLVDGGAAGIVGEATGMEVVYAHKGGCRLTITSQGHAAHSSTREGLNANLAMIPFLAEMKAIHDETQVQTKWHNSEFDPPTICWNIGINDYNYATNITAPQTICTIGFRPMPGTDVDVLLDRVAKKADEWGLDFSRDVLHPSFRTDPDGAFVKLACELSDSPPPRTVAYGSEASNLRGIKELILLGPGDIAQAHTHDEWIEVTQLERATQIYRALIDARCLS